MSVTEGGVGQAIVVMSLPESPETVNRSKIKILNLHESKITKPIIASKETSLCENAKIKLYIFSLANKTYTFLDYDKYSSNQQPKPNQLSLMNLRIISIVQTRSKKPKLFQLVLQ